MHKLNILNKYLFGANIYMNIFRCALQVTNPPNPTQGREMCGNIPTPNPAGDGGLTTYPRRLSKVSEATCLRPQRSAPSGLEPGPSDPESSALTSDHWATHASPKHKLLHTLSLCS